MRAIDRRIVIVKYLFPHVHRALSIMVILRERKTAHLVAVIALFSPVNQRRGKGREAYLVALPAPNTRQSAPQVPSHQPTLANGWHSAISSSAKTRIFRQTFHDIRKGSYGHDPTH
jgi:hypothetical protein